MYNCSYTTLYTYANQLVASTTDGKVTHYAYDAAGRLIKESDKNYAYDWLDKVLSVTENGKPIASFNYHNDGQIAQAIHNGKSEDFLWDGLALIHRGETSFINEPYVTGGNPILSSKDGVMFNDMLGSTLNIGGKAINMTAFGESADSNAMYTGKPYIGELGYAFLFRNYRSDYGKWQTTDPLGYPDGWNNLAYCKNKAIYTIDLYGGWTEGDHRSFFKDLTITIDVEGSYYILKQECIARIEFFDTMTDADASLTYYLTYNKEHIDFARTQHYHAMRSPDEDVTSAAKAIEALIESNFSKARTANSLDEALYYIGLASHTYQDRMAPQHYNSDEPLVWYPEDFTSIQNIWNHRGEIFVNPNQLHKNNYALKLKNELKNLVTVKPEWLTQLFVKE